jgi:hypothetical protein
MGGVQSRAILLVLSAAVIAVRAGTPPQAGSPAAERVRAAVAGGGGRATSWPTAAELVRGEHWTGTFTIRLQEWDYCRGGGTRLSPAGKSTHKESFSFSTSAPTDDGQGGRETNPFSFAGGTNPHDEGEVGLSVFSAAVLAADQTGTRRLMHQYWHFTYRKGRLSGRLVDNAVSLGAAYNGFFDNDDLVPCQPQQGTFRQYYPLSDGATLTAQLSAAHIAVQIEGQSVDHTRRVWVEAVGTAV